MRNGKSFDSFICKDSAGVGGRKGAALLAQQSRNESAANSKSAGKDKWFGFGF